MVLAAQHGEVRRFPGSPDIVKAVNLTRTFGTGHSQVVAVDGVSFAIPQGSVVSLLGESGSGKTTIARMLLRLLPPTSGQIYFHDMAVHEMKGKEAAREYWRRVQSIFQDPFASFNSFFRIRRVLEMALKFRGFQGSAEEREARMREAMETVGLSAQDLLDKYPHELSGGQRQRIMIARALLIDAELLIADEPTSMIDASSRASILNVLLDLNRNRGMSILFITHDIGLAYYTSDTILVMHEGKLVEKGSAEQVVHDPQHDYTRRLLADVPRLHETWDI